MGTGREVRGKRAPQRGAVWLGVAAHGSERPATINQSGGATPKRQSGPPKVAAALLAHPSKPPSPFLGCASGASHVYPPPHDPIPWVSWNGQRAPLPRPQHAASQKKVAAQDTAADPSH